MWTNDQPRSITPVLNSSADILSSSPIDHVDVSDHSSKDKTVINGNNEDSTDNEGDNEWNWEEETKEKEEELQELPQIEQLEMIEEKLPISLSFREKPVVTRPKIDDNIDDLDIKNKKLTKIQEKSEDFFSDFDMTPTFQKTADITTTPTEIDQTTSSSSRLQMSLIASDANDGWGDDDDNWSNNDDL